MVCVDAACGAEVFAHVSGVLSNRSLRSRARSTARRCSDGHICRAGDLAVVRPVRHCKGGSLLPPPCCPFFILNHRNSILVFIVDRLLYGDMMLARPGAWHGRSVLRSDVSRRPEPLQPASACFSGRLSCPLRRGVLAWLDPPRSLE